MSNSIFPLIIITIIIIIIVTLFDYRGQAVYILRFYSLLYFEIPTYYV